MLLVWRYDLCSGSAHEMCGRAGGGASATARDGRAGDDRFVEPKDRERARLRFDATDRRTRATGANAGAVGRRETAAQVIRPRMPEKLSIDSRRQMRCSTGTLIRAGLRSTV